jgi:hypothetical protein
MNKPCLVSPPEPDRTGGTAWWSYCRCPLPILVIFFLMINTAPAFAYCDQVRAAVAQYGYYTSLVWARAQGYSEASIRQAKACLTRKKVKEESRG